MESNLRIIKSVGLALAALLLVSGATFAQTPATDNLTGLSTFCSADGTPFGPIIVTIVNDDGIVQYNLSEALAGNAEATASLDQMADVVCQMGALSQQNLVPMPQESPETQGDADAA